MNSIFIRRSVREFLDKELENEKLIKIMQAAMQAPSAKNQQPWEFIVVSGKDNLAKLSQFNPNAKSLKNASVGIIVLGNTNRMVMKDYWQQELGAVTQNIMLEATELGLGSVWYGTTPNPARVEFINQLYNLEENLIPLSVIGIGYPMHSDANKFIDRYDESRIRYVK